MNSLDLALCIYNKMIISTHNNKKSNNMKEVDFYQVSLKLLLKDDSGAILILKAKEGDISEGYYDLPGGRIDKDEFNKDFVDIMRREVEEELGGVDVIFNQFPVAISRNTNTKTGNRILHLFFEAQYQGGEIRISDEHLSYSWIKLGEVNLEEYFTLGILDGVRMYVGKGRL
ncbi:MAG: NUDIX domain-containing protein [Minisyncoccus archaeiphilus]|nr:MAG: NUDIX domain-containing protein [Candidatus Parcubacteria bacterium]